MPHTLCTVFCGASRQPSHVVAVGRCSEVEESNALLYASWYADAAATLLEHKRSMGHDVDQLLGGPRKRKGVSETTPLPAMYSTCLAVSRAVAVCGSVVFMCIAADCEHGERQSIAWSVCVRILLTASGGEAKPAPDSSSLLRQPLGPVAASKHSTAAVATLRTAVRWCLCSCVWNCQLHRTVLGVVFQIRSLCVRSTW